MRNNLLSLLALVLLMLGFASCGKDGEVTELSIIPEPVFLTQKEGACTVKSPVKVFYENLTQNSPTVRYVDQALRQLNLRPSSVGNADKAEVVFVINTDKNDEIGDEGYLVEVSSDGVVISANTETGLFYGFQTFVQMLPDDVYTTRYASLTIPCCTILDYPAYEWRGSHMDVCRHFFSVEQIKKHLDIMAAYKMNRFHWHLTEDQGWRIEISKYPALTEVGAWRVDRIGEDWETARPPQEGEKATYGGFYSKQEVRDIVAYAAERHIEIVPEIEFPGHCCAALAAYPEFSCDNDDYFVAPADYWDSIRHTGGKAIMCAGNDKVMQFLKDVMDEVCDLFPYEYIHVGGDEANKLNWLSCPKCQQRIDELGLREKDSLKSCNNLQCWLTAEIEKYLIEKGKRIIGWDEILEGFVTKSCTVMSWRGTSGGIIAARNGNDVIMTPTSHCYFDYRQGDSLYQPKAIGSARRMTTLHKVYQFKPKPAELSPDEQKHILGGQCNLWAEYIETPEHQQYLLLPRMCAMSECLWTMSENMSWQKFQQKIEHHKDRISNMGYNLCWGSFKPEIAVDTVSDGSFRVSLSAEALGTQFHYTVDGSDPTQTSPVYSEPLSLSQGTELKTVATYRDKLREGVYSFKF